MIKCEYHINIDNVKKLINKMHSMGISAGGDFKFIQDLARDEHLPELNTTEINLIIDYQRGLLSSDEKKLFESFKEEALTKYWKFKNTDIKSIGNHNTYDFDYYVKVNGDWKLAGKDMMELGKFIDNLKKL